MSDISALSLMPAPFGDGAAPSLAPSLDELVAERPTTSATDTRPLDAGHILRLWTEGQRDLIGELRDYEVVSAFLSGEQWLTWNSAEARAEMALSGADDGEGRMRCSLNRMAPAARRMVAKLLRRPAMFDVIPNDADDASIRGANVGKAVLADYRVRHGWEDVRLDQAWEHLRGGTTVLMWDWDETAGDLIGYDRQTGVRVASGETIERVLSISEVAFEPGCRDAEHARWWIMGQALPPEEVQEHYQLPTKPPADAQSKMTPLTRALNTSPDGHKPNLTMVLTYFERPNWLRPEGARVCVVASQVVAAGRWPFPFTDHLNIAVAREIPNPKKWTGRSILRDAVGPQVAVNHGATSLLENAKFAGSPKFMYPRGSIDPQWMSNHPGEPLEYTIDQNGAKPSWEAAPAMPEWVSVLPATFEKEVDDVMGDYPIARGAPAGSVTSGSGLALLAEQGDSPLTFTSRVLAEAMGRMGSGVLETLAANVTTPRTARVPMGEKGPPEKVTWTGKDLHNQTNAVVPLEAVAPRTSGMSYQLGKELVQAGLITDVTQFARLAEVPGIEHLDEIVSPQLELAERENVALFTDAEMVPIPELWHNHRTHIDAHNRARSSDRYANLPDELKRVFDNHVIAHEKLSLEEALRMQLLAMWSPVLSGAAMASQPEQLQELLASIPPGAGGMPVVGGVQPAPPTPEQPPGQVAGPMPEQPEPQRL